jgi:hypothetical protein
LGGDADADKSENGQQLRSAPSEGDPASSAATRGGDEAAELPANEESRQQAASMGEEAVSSRQFLSHFLHRDVFELFFGVISSTIARCPFLSEREAHERVLKGLLAEVDSAAAAGDAPPFEHGGQNAVANVVINYVTASNELISNVPHDFSKLRAMCAATTQQYRRSVKYFEQQSAIFADLPPIWQMEVPTRKDRRVVKWALILDAKDARDEIAKAYGEIRDGCFKALKDEWLSLPIQERLAVAQVLDAMAGEGKQLMQGSRSSCPFPAPKRSAPALLVAEHGSGCKTALALALRVAKRLPQTFAADDELASLTVDHIIPGAVFLRFIGASSCASDGQSLLRSLILEMREILDPSSQQQSIPSTIADLASALLSCLQLASVECPVILVICGLDLLPVGDPVRELGFWLPQVLSPGPLLSPVSCRLSRLLFRLSPLPFPLASAGHAVDADALGWG